MLFCPECGHESETNGDWRVREADRRKASDRASGDEGPASREADRRKASDRASADGASRERAGDAVYECPDCGTEITTRRRTELPQYA